MTQRLATKLVCNVGEGRVCTASDRSDRAQANYNDQSEHNGVLNSCWAVFRLQETIELLGEILHGNSPVGSHPTDSMEYRKQETTNVATGHSASPSLTARLHVTCQTTASV